MGTHYKGQPAEVRALDLYVKLRRAANALQCRIEEGVHRQGLTENQFGVLECLLHIGPLHQCDLGAKLLTTRANITQIVDQLESRGLVRRARDEGDRRYFHVHLTEEGRRCIEGLFPTHLAFIQAQFSLLNAHEAAELERLLRIVGKQARDEPACP